MDPRGFDLFVQICSHGGEAEDGNFRTWSIFNRNSILQKMAILVYAVETTSTQPPKLATPTLAIRQPSVVTLAITRPTLTSTTIISLGNDGPVSTTAIPLAETSTSAEPTPAGGSGGISTTGVVILGLVLGLSCLTLLICFLCRNRCCRGSRSTGKSVKSSDYSCHRCRRSRGPRGRRGPRGLPGLPVRYPLP